MTSVETSKSLVRRHFEALNERNYAVLAEIHGADARNHAMQRVTSLGGMRTGNRSDQTKCALRSSGLSAAFPT